MPRRHAPVKATSGAGFLFEDKVGAYFLACMLNGDAPLGDQFGPPVRLDFNTAVIGWCIDDTLVEFRSGSRLALSIKSNKQISNNRLNEKFVALCWRLYLNDESQVFDRDKDLVGIATIPYSSDLRNDIDELLRWAETQDDVRFLAEVESRGSGNAAKRDWMLSLGCPTNLAAKHCISKIDSARLLRCLRILPFDFDRSVSEDERVAKGRCLAALHSESRVEANELWQYLVKFVAKHKHSGGYIDQSRLVTELHARHELKSWPDFASDFDSLRRWTKERLSTIPCRIGHRVRLSRGNEIDNISRASEANCFVAVTGSSGCGKSVAVKDWIEQLPETVPVLWCDGRIIEGNGTRDLQRTLGLTHRLEELARASPNPRAYCVIDRAGGLSHEQGHPNLRALANSLGIGDSGSPWRLLLVFQQEERDRVLEEFNTHAGKSINWDLVEIPVPNDAELALVWNAFPQLDSIRFRNDLHPILLRPKVLDLLASRVTTEPLVDPSKWVGESDLALWFLDKEVAKKPNQASRTRAACVIAERQADEVSTSVSTRDLPEGADYLINDHVLSLQDGSIAFQHDLFGDWARLRVLIDQGIAIPQFLESKLISPLWNRAVRLYGVYLLEKKGALAWKSALDLCDSSQLDGNLARDLILEAVIFAANPRPLLEDLWPVMCEKGGFLLRKLLGRFLYAATRPNPVYMALAKTPSDNLVQSTKERWPIIAYWIPVLGFLNAHRDDAVSLAPTLVAQVASMWLNSIPSEHASFRKDAADLALTLVNEVVSDELTHWRFADSTMQLALSTAMAAVTEHPDEVRELVLRMVGRRERPQRSRKRGRRNEPTRELIAENVFPEVGQTWPDGPLQEPNEQMRWIVFHSAAISPIIAATPEVASEAILALAILPPREYEDSYNYDYLLDDSSVYEIANDLRTHYPPFWWHPPWLTFLASQPVLAISTIVKLVNFATERYGESLERQLGRQMDFSGVDSTHNDAPWRGNQTVYFWHSGNTNAPHLVVSALMALEAWIYARIDSKQAVDEYIEQIIAASRSVAFAGVLASVGCKYPDMLKDSLKFLLSLPQIHYWERQKAVLHSTRTAAIAWRRLAVEDVQSFRNWSEMPHRGIGLDRIALELFFNDQQIQDDFVTIRDEWHKKRDVYHRNGDTLREDALSQLISVFTRDHYTKQYSNEHKSDLLIHQNPDETAADEQRSKDAEREVSIMLLRLSFPNRCREILDGKLQLGSDTEIESFLDDVNKLIINAELDNDQEYPIDVVAGGAAVLLCRHREYLSRNPDKAIEAHDTILRFIEEATAKNENAHGDEISGRKWTCFCADAMPYIWIAERSSSRVRKCVYLLAFCLDASVTARLIRGLRAARTGLGDDYTRIEVLIRLWAIEIPLVRLREDQLNGGFVLLREERRSYRAIMALDATIQAQLLSESFLKSIDEFVASSLSMEIPCLSNPKISKAKSARPRAGYERDRYRLDSLHDSKVIEALYSTLPPLSEALSSFERSKWIGVWEEMLDNLLSSLQPLSDEDMNKELKDLPYESDGWILDGVSKIILQMNSTEHPEQLWKKIFDLGWTCHHWIQDFITKFLLNNLGKTDDPLFRRSFMNMWSSMIEYCDSTTQWSGGDWYVCDIWEHLTGLRLLDVWVEAFVPLVTGMGDSYKTLCARHIGRSVTLLSLVEFLRRPASREIRVGFIVELEPHLSDIDSDDFRRHGIPERIGSLLAECWQSHRAELRSRPHTFGCFKRLVKLLADRQIVVALEIQNRMISG